MRAVCEIKGKPAGDLIGIEQIIVHKANASLKLATTRLDNCHSQPWPRLIHLGAAVFPGRTAEAAQ